MLFEKFALLSSVEGSTHIRLNLLTSQSTIARPNLGVLRPQFLDLSSPHSVLLQMHSDMLCTIGNVLFILCGPQYSYL